MTRQNGLGVFIIILATTLMGVVLLAISPVWLTILIINPRTFNSLTELATRRVTREVTKMMFKAAR